MILFTVQENSHSDTNNVDDETIRRRLDASMKYGHVCTCYHRKNVMWCDCVIFVKKNIFYTTQMLLMHYQGGTEK